MKKMDWKDKVNAGMALIIEGCKENDSWAECQNCPFDLFCTSIYRDTTHHYSTPDSFEIEGLFDEEGDK